jgi:flagellar hook protein FlgE
MSINSALLAGVSGLTANSAALAAISQNIANVNTVGYKRTSAEFSTIVNGQNSGAGYSAGGVLANTRNFISQAGQLQRTTSSTDLGIAGQGFFVTTEKPEGLDAGDARLFTRAGAFRVDDFGYLKNTSGLYLQGWPVDSEGNITTDPSDLGRLRSINVGSVGGTAEPTTRAQLNANLRSSQPVSPLVAPAIKNGVPDSATPSALHDYTVQYTRTGANQWNVTVTEPSSGTTFTGAVTYDATTGALLTSTLPGGSTTALTIAPGVTVPLSGLGLATSGEVLSRYDVTTNSMSTYDAEAETGFKPDFQITVPVSDSKGGQRTIAYSFLKTANPNEWRAEMHVIPASDIDNGSNPPNGILKAGLVLFTQDGRLDVDAMKAREIATPGSMLFADPSTASITLNSSDSAVVASATAPKWKTSLGIDDQSVAFDLSASAGGLTQYDSDSIVQAVVTNGTAFGNLSNIEIDEEGFVTAIFDNGVTRRIAQVALATFVSADSLTPANGNAYRVSQGSGTYNLKTPGAGGAGLIGSSQLEASTVDLSLEFTGLITTQRAYSASSKIITTADEMLAELISIKR